MTADSAPPARTDFPYALARRLREWFHVRAGLRSVLANSVCLLLDRVLRIVLSITVGAWVARHLGPANFGQLAYALAMLALFQAACSLGLDGPVIRDISQNRAQAAPILGSAFRLRLLSGIAGWLAMIALTALLQPGDVQALWLVVIVGASLVFQPAEVVDLWLQSQVRSSVSVPLRFLSYCTVAAIRVGLILSDAPLWCFAAAALADMVFVAVALAWAYTRWPVRAAWTWDGTFARRICQESWPLMVSALSIGIYMRIDQVVLRQLAGEHELGLYSAILPFSQGWQIVPMTLYASLLPKLAQSKTQDPVQYQRRLQQIYTAFFWMGIFVAAATALCGSWLVALLLGPAFAEAVPILHWHVFTNVFIFLGVAQSLAIVTDRTPTIALRKTVFGAATSLIANCLLVPRWGAVGSAAAALISQFVSVVLSNALVAPQALHMQLRALWPFMRRGD